MGVSANLGAKINIRKRAVRIDPNVVEDVGTEWGNKRDRMSLKIGDTGNKTKKIALDKFLLRNPKLFSTVVDDCVLVQVAVNDVSTSRGMEEFGEEVLYRYFWE